MLGTCTGAVTIGVVDTVTGERTSNVCTISVNVTSQLEPGYRFAGTFQTSGGTTVPCGQVGDASGFMLQTVPRATESQASNAVSLELVVRMGSPPDDCGVVIDSSVLSGAVTGNVLSALTPPQVVTCGTLTVYRSLLVTVVR